MDVQAPPHTDHGGQADQSQQVSSLNNIPVPINIQYNGASHVDLNPLNNEVSGSSRIQVAVDGQNNNVQGMVQVPIAQVNQQQEEDKHAHQGVYLAPASKECLVSDCNEKPDSSGFCQIHNGSVSHAARLSTQHKNRNAGFCEVAGCKKLSRGSSKRCITHGGGKRCTVEGCMSAGRTQGLCKLHGGGRRCNFENCRKSAQGSTPYCKTHGGGRRCIAPDCKKSAEAPSSYCITHGGGLRCSHPDCKRSARGKTKFCISHGGGTRCGFEGCDKGARNMSSGFCKMHMKKRALDNGVVNLMGSNVGANGIYPSSQSVSSESVMVRGDPQASMQGSRMNIMLAPNGGGMQQHSGGVQVPSGGGMGVVSMMNTMPMGGVSMNTANGSGGGGYHDEGNDIRMSLPSHQDFVRQQQMQLQAQQQAMHPMPTSNMQQQQPMSQVSQGISHQGGVHQHSDMTQQQQHLQHLQQQRHHQQHHQHQHMSAQNDQPQQQQQHIPGHNDQQHGQVNVTMMNHTQVPQENKRAHAEI